MRAIVIASSFGLLTACAEVEQSAARHAEPSAPVEIDLAHLDRIDGLVEEALVAERMPGCVVVIGRRDAVVYREAFGHRSLRPAREPMTLDTVFDLASLTKPIATATSVMVLLEQGHVRLRDPLARYWPEFGEHGKDQVRVHQLLTHVGGLIPDNALSDYADGPDESWRRIAALSLESPPGERFVYTDVGFQALGKMVERVSGTGLDEFSRASVFEPLGMHETGFRPGPSLRERAATTEQREGRWMRGEVHDPRAFALGGVAGHAGLFSTADDLARYARAMLGGGELDGRRILSARTVERMTAEVAVPGGSRSLGWDKKSRFDTNRGELFSDRAFGHGGFTGTSLWIDPEQDLFVLFLSNRVHPDGEGSVNDLAGRIAAVATTALVRGAGRPVALPRASGGASEVLPGIDVLEREDFAAIGEGRVGLVCNHTALSRDGRRTIDVLHAAAPVDLVALFSPEHGLRGRGEGKIPDGRDEASGLPIYSLYGETRRPAPEVLDGLDVLVFDVQDVGTRFYTYLATMGMCMEACAEAGARFVVLDRPNPIGGAVGGSVRDPELESFVAYHAVPVRHGMTAGEIARLARHERGLEVDLRVVPVQGWRRGDFFDATGLPWVDPSPNLRCVNQALLYPGIGLLEFTNVSVGRGTDTPFERVGAPWLDGAWLARELNASSLAGVRFTPVRFVPGASKFAGEECGGVQVQITDRAALDPLRVGLEIATRLRDGHADDWEGEAYARLLADEDALAAFRGGASAVQLQRGWAAEIDEFRRRREAWLLYE